MAAAPEPQPEVSMEIGTDERRMHVRAYNYWCSLLGGRDYPSIEDLEPGSIQDFGAHSVLLDFTEGSDNPAMSYIGAAIREECGLADDIQTITDVPGQSLLSRLTDHYMQIITNRAPVGFEAEFVNQRGRSIRYRGILMPFSSDDDTIDFIYGVINWKDVGEIPQVIRAALPPLEPEADDAGKEEMSELVETEAGEADEMGMLELAELVPADPEVAFNGVVNWKDAGGVPEIPQVIRAAFPPLEPEAYEAGEEEMSELVEAEADEADEGEIPELVPAGPEVAFNGAVNWNGVGEAPKIPQVIRAALPPREPEVDETGEGEMLAQVEPVPAGPEVSFNPEPEPEAEVSPPTPRLVWEDGPPLADAELSASEDEEEESAIELDADAGLADRLWAARESAEVCKQQDGRSRVALYRTLAMAYDFAVAAKRVPEDYAEILDGAGVKSQARAPMTPIVKLVFGVDYDKTRLTEFAAALSCAEREKVEFGGFQMFVEQAEGGLKGLIAAERKARRPDKPVEDRVEAAKAVLRAASPLALAQLPTNQEFALVLTRRNINGMHEVVELVADAVMLDRALRNAAR